MGSKRKAARNEQKKERHTWVVIQYHSEELLDAISVSKGCVERLDQLQIAESDGLDKNFTRGFKRSRTCFGEKQLPSRECT